MVRVNWQWCCGILAAIAISPCVILTDAVKASNWDGLWKNISLRPKPPLGGRGDFCPISPRLVKDSIELVSGDRLLLVWDGAIGKVEIHEAGNDAPLWGQVIDREARQLLYTGTPLIAGARYEWWIFNRFAVNETKPTLRIPFQVLDSSERDRVAIDLDNLNTKIRSMRKWASMEEWTQMRSQYFVSQGLYVDAMREILSVQRPSQELRSIWQKLPDVCRR